jgi:hypothetical protein
VWRLCSYSNHIQIVFTSKIDVLKIILPIEWIGQANLVRPVLFIRSSKSAQFVTPSTLHYSCIARKLDVCPTACHVRLSALLTPR